MHALEWRPLLLPGMPDFLEKLHNAALRAKNLEVGIHDYAGVIKSSDGNRQSSQERLGGDNSHTGGSGQIYAWGRRRGDRFANVRHIRTVRPNLWYTVAKWSCCLQ